MNAFSLPPTPSAPDLQPFEFELDELDRELSERIRDGLQQHLEQQNAREALA